MFRITVSAASLSLFAAASALADEAPAPPPPQHEFIGKGQFGFLSSKGNSDATSLNAALDILRYDGPWKNELAFAGLYGKSGNVISAERWGIRQQTDYAITVPLFAFESLHFDHDMFNGFLYQASITGGIGYKILDTNDTKLTAQVGAGYRRFRPELIDKEPDGSVAGRTPLDGVGEAIGTFGLDASHAFNKSTVLSNKLLVEAGSSNTTIHDDIALTVKMSDHLALSAGYGFLDNTKPPAGLKRLDTVATLNVVFGF
jgi:putative salt-induced outer membrane protein